MSQQNEYHTIIIGGGHSGLATSYHLKCANIEHTILERDTIASRWTNDTWDSFSLVTPLWMNQLPGLPYPDRNEGKFLTKIEYIAYLQHFQKKFNLPIRDNSEVTRLRFDEHKAIFKLETTKQIFYAQNVVIATSAFNVPFIPPFSKQINQSIKQYHSSEYKNPQQFSSDAILVIGSGQSGVQICSELLQAGKKTFLAVSRTGRVPRSYRNKDITEWIKTLEEYETITPSLETLNGKFPNNPYVGKVAANYAYDILDLEERGLTLIGSIATADNYKLQLRDNLQQCLDYADEVASTLTSKIDNYLGMHSGELAKQDKTIPRQPLPHLDLQQLQINTIIWASGYKFDFDYIELPIFDKYGFPITENGTTTFPGIYFVGLNGSYKLKTGLIYGATEQAQHVAEQINKQYYNNKTNLELKNASSNNS